MLCFEVFNDCVFWLSNLNQLVRRQLNTDIIAAFLLPNTHNQGRQILVYVMDYFSELSKHEQNFKDFIYCYLYASDV